MSSGPFSLAQPSVSIWNAERRRRFEGQIETSMSLVLHDWGPHQTAKAQRDCVAKLPSMPRAYIEGLSEAGKFG